MDTVSLESLQDREYRLLDNVDDGMSGLSRATTTDRYMEINNGRMGEDSEETTVREKHTRKVLSRGPLPSYNPFG